MNKAALIGRLTADPQLKFTPGTGTAVATFTIAIDRRFKKEGGEKETYGENLTPVDDGDIPF